MPHGITTGIFIWSKHKCATVYYDVHCRGTGETVHDSDRRLESGFIKYSHELFTRGVTTHRKDTVGVDSPDTITAKAPRPNRFKVPGVRNAQPCVCSRRLAMAFSCESEAVRGPCAGNGRPREGSGSNHGPPHHIPYVHLVQGTAHPAVGATESVSARAPPAGVLPGWYKGLLTMYKNIVIQDIYFFQKVNAMTVTVSTFTFCSEK
jgi:hypothetical protein